MGYIFINETRNHVEIKSEIECYLIPVNIYKRAQKKHRGVRWPVKITINCEQFIFTFNEWRKIEEYTKKKDISELIQHEAHGRFQNVTKIYRQRQNHARTGFSS